MPSPQRARLAALPDARRAQLLDPAEREFATHGFAHASLNRILTNAGMSKGQAYHYITGKTDLYAAVLQRAFARLLAKMDFEFGNPDQPDAFWARVNALLTRLSTVLHSDARLAALAMGVYESPQTRVALTETSATIRARFAALIAQGQALGAVRADLPDDLLMDMFFAMASETDRWFAAHWQALDAAELTRLNQVVLSMFRAAAEPPKKE
ncbi:TetR/AcrR family transcriptional regulator [Aquicoccus sp. G2-2]|uniref:TetR/AcrR family transcriptional regulator n=1 Tax=Aquicoccus sp. G2-2 TaxID=3092120 RepID=UPI002AE0780A|nr:TetR/AcrR family transcriptional regulator [Aquicoccus sp. G2-2]MEA1113107.1 TetR/AcrR family transcriptional regulator [Aquicoccus sp. G2-2]